MVNSEKQEKESELKKLNSQIQSLNETSKEKEEELSIYQGEIEKLKEISEEFEGREKELILSNKNLCE